MSFANNIIDFRQKKAGIDEETIVRVDLEDSEESEKEHLPKGRDGNLLDRYKYMRKDVI